ncbi:tape measure protein [Kordiimonas sp.]|uniref:tape measure protein n=1 Tax=Kordiimonas sp. TaxID=1970157 RepID=UPI003A93F8BB
MAVDLTSLEIRIRSREARTADKNLDGLEKQAVKTERATDGLTAAFLRLAGPVALVAAGVKGVTETARVTREFGILEAQLETATGSTRDAADAFEEIQRIAADTPYDLQQVTESFTRLVNVGLNPSAKALLSYGNTAAGMSKDLSQLIEAAADAVVGEFERLKEFNIKARNQGDQISFTFQGVTTKVRNNAKEIEDYLLSLGEVNFAGGMERRMNSLDGALSNFGDAWDKTVLDVSNAGLGEAIESSVRVGIDVLEELGVQVRSLRGEADLVVVQRQIEETGEKYAETAELLRRLQEGGADGRQIQIVSDKLSNLSATLSLLDDQTEKITANQSAGDALAKFATITSGDPTAFNKLQEKLLTEEEALQKSYDERVKIVADREADITNAIKAAEDLLQKDISDAQRKSTEGKLEEFRKELAEFEATKDRELARAKKAFEEEKQARIRSVTDALANEHELLGLSFDDRQRKIDEIFADDEAKRLAATERNIRMFEDETRDLVEAEKRRRFELEEARIDERNSLQSLEERLMTEAEAYIYHNDLMVQAEREHQRIIDEIKTNAYLDEEQRNAAMLKEEIRFQEAKARAAIDTDKMRLHSAAATANSLGQIAQGIFGEQSKAAKVMFAINKAFTIAQGSLATLGAISEAMRQPFPANIPLIAQATAQGASLMASIRGVQYSGAYDDGGHIPAGKWGIVGEFGPEIAKGPMNITSRRETAAMARQAMGGAGKTVSIDTLLKVEWHGAAPESPEEFAAKAAHFLKDEMRTGGLLEGIAA